MPCHLRGLLIPDPRVIGLTVVIVAVKSGAVQGIGVALGRIRIGYTEEWKIVGEYIIYVVAGVREGVSSWYNPGGEARALRIVTASCLIS